MRKYSCMYLIPVLLMLFVPLPLMVFADDYVRGDCDQNGTVDIDDVTSLIDYILNGRWNDVVTPVETETFTVNGCTFKMVKVEGCTFTMGATEEQMYTECVKDNEKPAHDVTLSTYYIGQTEVTQQLWIAVMGTNPSPSSQSDDWSRPVTMVSWSDCHTFINELNALTGLQFRLPTEAEWECAARGGDRSNGYIYSGSNNLDEVAWYTSNSGGKTHSVATKQPNELGIYDMSGNVCEWCQDWYSSTYYSVSPAINPTGPTYGSSIVVRDGAYNNNNLSEKPYRVSKRGSLSTDYRHNSFGFRLALSLETE